MVLTIIYYEECSMKLIFKIILILFIVLILFVFCKFMDMSQKQISMHSPYSFSGSMKESISDKVFVQKVNVYPNSIKVNGTTVKFTECWLERSARVTFHYLFIRKIEFIENDYKLCFKIKPKLNSLRFYNDSVPASSSTFCGDKTYAFHFANSDVPNKLKVRVSYDEKTIGEITFVKADK